MYVYISSMNTENINTIFKKQITRSIYLSFWMRLRPLRPSYDDNNTACAIKYATTDYMV